MIENRKDYLVVVWEVGTGLEVTRFKGHARQATCLAFTPDGRYLVSGSQDQTLRVWRLPESKSNLPAIAPIPTVAEGVVGETRRFSYAGERPRVSGDGRVLTVVQEGRGKVFDMATGELLVRTRSHAAKSAAPSNDGRYLVTATASTLHVWETKTGQLVRRVPCAGVIRSFRLTPDNLQAVCVLQRDAYGQRFSAVRVDLRTGTELQQIDYPIGARPVTAFSRDATKIAVARGSELEVLSTEDSSSLGRFWLPRCW